MTWDMFGKVCQVTCNPLKSFMGDMSGKVWKVIWKSLIYKDIS